MDTLSKMLHVLESILVPTPGYTNETRVYPPDPADDSPEALLKRDLISRSFRVLDAGKATLRGAQPREVSAILGDEMDRMDALQTDDPEMRDFAELLHHATVIQAHINERALGAI